jgi:hypothetical protein
MKGHIKKQDRGHTHTHMGKVHGKDPHASREYNAANAKHGMHEGMCGGMSEACDEQCGNSEESESEIE